VKTLDSPQKSSDEIVAGNVRYVLSICGSSNSVPLRDILGVSVKRARDLYAGRASFFVTELVALGAATGVKASDFLRPDESPRTFGFRDQYRRRSATPSIPARKSLAAHVEASNALGAALAADVWNLANDMQMLELVVNERLFNVKDNELHTPKCVINAARTALVRIAHELRLSFPDRSTIGGSSTLG
jgi:hypothetical protein